MFSICSETKLNAPLHLGKDSLDEYDSYMNLWLVHRTGKTWIT